MDICVYSNSQPSVSELAMARGEVLYIDGAICSCSYISGGFTRTRSLLCPSSPWRAARCSIYMDVDGNVEI